MGRRRLYSWSDPVTGANEARHRCEPIRQRRWVPDTAEAREGVEVTKDFDQIWCVIHSESCRMMHIAERPNDRNTLSLLS